jgi:hypothetical protein
MGKFFFNGLDEIAASCEQLARLDDNDKLSLLIPAGELVLKRQKEKIAELFKRRTGDLQASLTLEQREGEESPSVVIYPAGKHRSSFTGKRMKKDKDGKRRASGKYSGTNAEVAYILNYGSPRIAATHWLEKANEEVKDEVIAAQQEAWDKLVTEKGL